MDAVIEYELVLVNMMTGCVAKLYAYRISDIVYEENVTSGVCLFFDKDKELISVVSSYDDIVDNARDFFSNEHCYYAMMMDEEEMLTEDEIDELFYGIKSGTMNIIRVQPYDEIRLDICLN